MPVFGQFLPRAALAASYCLFPVFCSAGAITADDLVARNVEARGGAAALGAVRNLQRSGRQVIPGFPAEIAVSDLRERPGRVRLELTFQGLTQVNASDGEVAWQIQPFEGRKQPARMSDDDARALKLSADIDGPWVDARRKGHEIEYLGTEDIDGTMAHKMRVRLQWGDAVTVWFDSDSWMLIRDLRKTIVRGSEQEVETDYGDYEKVAGVYVPMREESGPPNSPPGAKVTSIWERAQANGSVSRGVFEFPRPATAASGEGR
jgi:hypothetical protein